MAILKLLFFRVWRKAPNNTGMVLNSTENKLNYVLVKCSLKKFRIEEGTYVFIFNTPCRMCV